MLASVTVYGLSDDMIDDAWLHILLWYDALKFTAISKHFIQIPLGFLSLIVSNCTSPDEREPKAVCDLLTNFIRNGWNYEIRSDYLHTIIVFKLYMSCWLFHHSNKHSNTFFIILLRVIRL
jgi:hypothetical protein